jgi:hypothetical protein
MIRTFWLWLTITVDISASKVTRSKKFDETENSKFDLSHERSSFANASNSATQRTAAEVENEALKQEIEALKQQLQEKDLLLANMKPATVTSVAELDQRFQELQRELETKDKISADLKKRLAEASTRSSFIEDGMTAGLGDRPGPFTPVAWTGLLSAAWNPNIGEIDYSKTANVGPNGDNGGCRELKTADFASGEEDPKFNALTSLPFVDTSPSLKGMGIARFAWWSPTGAETDIFPGGAFVYDCGGGLTCSGGQFVACPFPFPR